MGGGESNVSLVRARRVRQELASPLKEDEMRYACGYIINFNDGKESEEQILHIGTLEECQKTGKLFHAVSYSGNRPIKDCKFIIVPMKESP